MSVLNNSTHAVRDLVRVVVTGMGVVSPIGTNLQDAWSKLKNSESGIKKLTDEKYHNLPCKVAGTIENIEDLLGKHFSNSDLRTMAPSTALALIAAKEAMERAKLLPLDECTKKVTGVAVGVGMIDLNDVCKSYEDLKCKGYKKVSPYFVPRILPNMAAGQISIKFGLRGPNHSVSTACATGAHSIGDAFRFIRNGDASIMICGGAESCINPLSIAGFCRLRALSSSYNNFPLESSRPFDSKRDGFVMSEGSAILVLEELNHAKQRKVDILAEVLGYGLSGDAAHLTAPSEDGTGAMLAMERALKDAQLKPQDIGYINAHATSTPLGDAIEAKAIRSLFQNYEQDVRVSSTKGSHGHLLGAAGNLEAAFTIMACLTGELPPNINLEKVDEGMELNYVANRSEKWATEKRRVALKNAFGFGGTNACLCLAEYKE